MEHPQQIHCVLQTHFLRQILNSQNGNTDKTQFRKQFKKVRLTYIVQKRLTSLNFFINLLQGYKAYFYKKPAEDNKDGIFIATKIPLDEEPLVKFYFENGKQQNQFFIYITHLKAKPKFEQVRKEQLSQLAANFTDLKNHSCWGLQYITTSRSCLLFPRGYTIKNNKQWRSNYSKEQRIIRSRNKGITFQSYIPNLPQDEQGLPSEHFPSDHLNLMARFRIY